MVNIYEYLLSKSKPKINMIKATDENIHQIVKDELDRLGHDADLNHIDVSEVTTMYNLFNCVYNPYISYGLGPEYGDLNPDISEWDVSNTTNMDSMFKFCSNFNSDIRKWDVSNVTNMYCMFYACEKFNRNISDWNVRKVESMGHMFWGCESFNQNISRWDVCNVKKYGNIFESCPIKEEFKPKFKN